LVANLTKIPHKEAVSQLAKLYEKI